MVAVRHVTLTKIRWTKPQDKAVHRNSLIGPRFTGLDASIEKKFQVGLKYAEFRVEVFNLPNLPIWGQPGSQLKTPTYGVITGTRIDSRQIQLGLKFVF